MNKNRRNEIELVITEIENFVSSISAEDDTQLISEGNLNTLTGLANELENIKSEEEEYRDNMPENLQNSERFYAADEACNNLENALDSLQNIDNSTTIEDCINSLEAVLGYLSDAAQ